MKKLNSIVCIMIGITACAQPSITRLGVDRVNATITFKAGDAAATDTPGPSGANITWDFSAYTGPNVTTTNTNECPGQANCFRFAGANRITKPTLSDVYDFASITDTEAITLGSYAGSGFGDATTTYTDPLIDFKFPITYLQQFSDTYQFTNVSAASGTTNESGQVDYTVDGYGTVITPTGTYSNVLRMKSMKASTIIVPGSPLPFNYTNENYTWISQTSGIVFTFGINTFAFNGVPNISKYISYLDTLVLSTAGSAGRKTEISVYPNPGSDFINLESKEDIKKVSVNSLDGKTVLITDSAKNINISNLPKGTYILQAELKNGGSVTRKIIKK
ncbi:T9SS type A sorting domain-containing protein [Chryseobacterium sp. WG14]|uniref:T9SS type A sorting domain-containing protein n=1 Tax=Chryseobacterium sp. WG14 TaxID=2926909 RepID=UPI00211E4F24|nr:T9SS type A sorting domain-containing protein [Chryseobacterium sp. WG14]MCQ9639431.1 T9SS type A sorting domain-containing protein [Chryseobacterium sp. WG14]